MNTFYIKQGNTMPAFVTELTKADGSPVNLSGARVRFVMSTFEGRKLVDKKAEVIGHTRGRVRYTPSGDDTSVVTSTPRTQKEPHIAEWRVDWYRGSNLVQSETFPTDGYDRVVVYGQI